MWDQYQYIKGVQVRGARGPIDTSAISFVCIAGNYSALKFGLKPVKDIFGGVTSGTILLEPIARQVKAKFLLYFWSNILSKHF